MITWRRHTTDDAEAPGDEAITTISLIGDQGRASASPANSGKAGRLLVQIATACRAVSAIVPLSGVATATRRWPSSRPCPRISSARDGLPDGPGADDAHVIQAHRRSARELSIDWALPLHIVKADNQIGAAPLRL